MNGSEFAAYLKALAERAASTPPQQAGALVGELAAALLSTMAPPAASVDTSADTTGTAG